MTPRFRFDGIYTPVVTPFAADFSVRWDALEAVIDWLIGQGVHGLISGGSTGENYAQTLDERIEIARFTVDKTAGRRCRSQVHELPGAEGEPHAGTAEAQVGSHLPDQGRDRQRHDTEGEVDGVDPGEQHPPAGTPRRSRGIAVRGVHRRIVPRRHDTGRARHSRE